MVPLKPPYDNIGQAFQHLIAEDHYESYEERPQGDMVVAFFPSTMAVRLFKTLENVGRFYAWSMYRADIYVKPEQFAVKFTTPQLQEFCKRVDLPFADRDGLDMAYDLWRWCQDRGDVVTQFGGGVKGLEPEKYTVRRDLIKSPEYAEDIAKLPKQAKIICLALGENDKSTYTEAEWTTFAINLQQSGQLKTKQDPVRVCDYYRGTLADLGVFSYTTMREHDEEEGDDPVAEAA